MLYVKDSNILTLRQLLNMVKVMRAQPPRQQDLDDWGAFELQPDKPPIGDVVTTLQTAIQAQDGLWYRDYDVRAFTPEELASHQEQAISQLNSLLDAKVESLADKFPRYERETWPKQIEEASAWIADNSALTPTIDRIKLDNETKLELCTAVLEKAKAYQELADTYVRIRRQYRDAIRAAGSRAEIDSLIEEVRLL